MGFWSTQVAPRLVDAGGEDEKMMALRAETCRGLRGEVLELGFGSGLNIAVYPAEVTHVVAIEPSDVAWQLSARRRSGSHVPITRGDLDGQWLTLEDRSVDSALSTFTLCTIPDVTRALSEVRRVLKPGGALHFFEHGTSPDPGVQAWQRRLEPLQKRVFDGCHLTRDIDALIEESGLVLERMDKSYGPFPKAMRPWTFGYLGVARKP